MNKRPIIIVDADAIIAQTNPEDLLHKKATTISKKLIDMDAEVYYPVTAIAEAATHMQRVLNSNASAFGTAHSGQLHRFRKPKGSDPLRRFKSCTHRLSQKVI